MAVTLTAPPATWDAANHFVAAGSLSAPTNMLIEPVGPHFLAHARRLRHNRTFSEDDKIQAEANAKNVEAVEEEEEEEPEDPAMLKSDPKDWKNQDHYAVLGLSKYRYKADNEMIKRAHRRKVLKHHPDKKAASGNFNDDAFFKCIQKAHEVLSDPVRRRQYDSVDESANVEPPVKKAKGDFPYKSWNRVFAAEGRFSNKHPVPLFGNEDSSRHEVEAFYDFFYHFDSWRTFEYLDKDIPDDSDNRDQKRYQEKKNKADRAKRKTEDTARLRKLVDDVLAQDPRIKMFKQAEKEAKEKAKWERERGAREAAEAAKRAEEEEAARKQKEEEEAKLAAADKKAQKEKAKKESKKNKKTIKNALKEANYFSAEGAASAAQVDGCLDDYEKVSAQLEVEDIADLAKKLEGLKVSADIHAVFKETAGSLVAAGKLKAEELKVMA
ncbi:Zuotin [Saitoella coloradoensis]